MKKMMKKGSVLIMLLTLALTFENCSKEVLPDAQFTFSPTSAMVYEEVQFTNRSTDADSYLWDFGGGNTTTEANPLVTFTTAGEYTVRLTATNGDGSTFKESKITISGSTYMLDDDEFEITEDFFLVSIIYGWRSLFEIINTCGWSG